MSECEVGCAARQPASVREEITEFKRRTRQTDRRIDEVPDPGF